MAYLATRVTRCSVDDLAKLERLLKYVNATKDRGIVFAAGYRGIEISVLIDAAYGVAHWQLRCGRRKGSGAQQISEAADRDQVEHGGGVSGTIRLD